MSKHHAKTIRQATAVVYTIMAIEIARLGGRVIIVAWLMLIGLLHALIAITDDLEKQETE
jgi:hypothetical protein